MTITRGGVIMSFHWDKETPREYESTNKNYESDTYETLRYTIWLFKILGIWPHLKINPSDLEIRVAKIFNATCLVLMSFILIPLSLYTIYVEKRMLVKIMLSSPLSYCFGNMVKYSLMIFRREDLKHCMEHVKIDWMMIKSQNDREIMMRNVKDGRRISVICALFLYIGGISYHTILPLWQGSSINEFNVTIRPLAYPGYDIFVDPNISPNYEIIFSTITVTSWLLFTLTLTACNLSATFVTHICGQIEIIMSRFDTFFDKIGEPDEMQEGRIGEVIKSHVRVLRLSAMLETVFCELCFIEIGTMVIALCSLEYSCLKTWSDSDGVAIFTYVVLLVSTSFDVFIFCYIGELLKGQCAQIGNVAYTMGWYRLPGRTGLAIIMIIAMSNCPRKLTAGRILELSVYSFGSIMRTTVAYLNMIRTMAA